jgi:hypothetical protein
MTNLIFGQSSDFDYSLPYFREGMCGAWSYNHQELYCYLHTSDSCCGQFGKREENPDFISGYSCNVCWSTKRGTECPCPLGERLGNSGTWHSEGGKPPLHNGPTVTFSISFLTNYQIQLCT